MRSILKLCVIVVLSLSIFKCVLDLGESDVELIVDVSEDILSEADSLEAIAEFGDTTLTLYQGTTTDGVFADGIGSLVKDSVQIYLKQFKDGKLLRNVKYSYERTASKLSLISKECLFPLCYEFFMDITADVNGNVDSLAAEANYDINSHLLKRDSLFLGRFRDTLMGENLDTVDVTVSQFDNSDLLQKKTRYIYSKKNGVYELIGKECIFPKCVDVDVDLSHHILNETAISINTAYFDTTSTQLNPGASVGTFTGKIEGNNLDSLDLILTQYDKSSDILLQTLYRYSTVDKTVSFIGVLAGDRCQILYCRVNRRIRQHVIINDTTSKFGTVSNYFYGNEILDSIVVYNGSINIEPSREPSGVRRFEYGLNSKRVIQEFIQEPTVDSLYEYNTNGDLIKVQVEERGLVEMDTVIYKGSDPHETRHYSDGVLTRIVRHTFDSSTFTIVDSIFVGHDSSIWGVEEYEYKNGLLQGKKTFKRRSGTVQLTESVEYTYDSTDQLIMEQRFDEGLTRSLVTILSYEYKDGELVSIIELDGIGNRLVYVMTFEYEGEKPPLMKRRAVRSIFPTEITVDRINNWNRNF